MAHRFTHKKRRSAGPSEPETGDGIDDELEALRAQVATLEAEKAALIRPMDCAGVPHMKVAGDRKALSDALYAGNYAATMQILRDNNRELVCVLYAQMSNQSDETETLLAARSRMVDGILLDICRAQNILHVPVVTAALSILGEFNHVAREYHDSIAQLHRGVALSEKWVRDFLADARKWRPEPPFERVAGVTVAVFDNLTMKVDYSSYSTQGETGHKLDMTNWLSTPVPVALAPSMDARKICKCSWWAALIRSFFVWSA